MSRSATEALINPSCAARRYAPLRPNVPAESAIQRRTFLHILPGFLIAAGLIPLDRVTPLHLVATTCVSAEHRLPCSTSQSAGAHAERVKPASADVQLQEIRAGTGTHPAQRGDLVLLHYVGTLPDGTVFDSTRGGLVCISNMPVTLATLSNASFYATATLPAGLLVFAD